MALKRRLASTARGFYCFCLAPSIRKPIRPIRGRTEEPILWRTTLNVVGFAFVFSPRHSLSKLSSALICTRFQAATEDTIYIRGSCPRILMVVPSRHRSAYGVVSVVRKGRVITGRGCREGETERGSGHERFPPVRGKGLPEEDMGCPTPHTYMHLRYDMGEAPHAL